ncbi:MAG: Holliday junction resolvase RuvX [Candidatus Uhrbacteria bacterium]
MSILLGIDYGAKKIGLAIAEGQIASPLRVVRWETHRDLAAEIRRACEEYGVRSIVVGIPRPLRVKENAQMREAEEFVEWLQREMTLPVVREDERLTTAFAAKLTRGWKKKADDDAIAAALILQSYIERTA